MKMKKTAYKSLIIALPILVVLSLGSCQRIMDSGKEGKSILFVECIQGISDTTAINVIATAPKFGYSQSRVPDGAKVSLKAGGREILLKQGEVSTALFPVGAFYTTEKIEGGQTLELTVSAPGIEPVSATTVKPADVRPFGTTLVEDVIYGDDFGLGGESKNVVRMDITPEDDSIEDHYYMLMFEEMTWLDEKTYVTRPYPVLRDGGFYTSDFGDAEVVTAKISRWSFFGTSHISSAANKILNAYIWRGTSLAENGKLSVYFNDDRRSRRTMRATLMTVSPEFYRYAKSMEYNNDDNDILSPFFPSSYAYTNVKGGCGVFGAVSYRVGEWVSTK